MPIFVAVTTGMRRGEILALRRADIDLGTKTISVRRSLEVTREGLNFKHPKTKKSRRSIAIADLLVEALGAHRRLQAEERLRFGPGYESHDLVCARPDGSPWDPRAFSKAFAALIEKSDVRRVRFHDLRHSHASQLLRQGVHPKIMSEWLGHATVATTLDRYSHVLPGLQEDAAAKVDSVLRASLAGN